MKIRRGKLIKLMRYLTTHVGVKGRGWRLCLAVRVFDTLTAHTHTRTLAHAQATLGNTSGAFCLLPVILRVCLFLAELQMASPPLSGSATPTFIYYPHSPHHLRLGNSFAFHFVGILCKCIHKYLHD